MTTRVLTHCPTCQALMHQAWPACAVCGQARPAARAEDAAAAPEPLSPTYPCVGCGSRDRWNHHGVWRCAACWPPDAFTPRKEVCMPTSPPKKAGARTWRCEVCGMVQTRVCAKPYLAYCKSLSCRQERLFVPWEPASRRYPHD